jgi:geranylgeranyl reductase family protein
MRIDYDVIIVGAGPSGCSAAYDLSNYGLSVLLVDKTEFPRLKPCGGGITIKTLQALRYSISPVIQHICYDLVVGRGVEKSHLFKSKHPICAMTVRQEFDEYCLKMTLKNNITFKIIKQIKSLKELPEGVEMDTSEGVLNCRYIVGADGANSMVRKLSNQFEQVEKGLAIEGHVYMPKDQLPEMEFDFGAAKFGYGWLFPKGDHVNIGLYTNDPSTKLTKKDVQEYASKKLGNVELHNVVGHYIGLNGRNYSQTSDKIFLIGDAAGFVDPLLGEGIYNAVISGQFVAKAINDEIQRNQPAKKSYNESLKIVKADLNECYQSALWFYKYPRIGYNFLTFKPTEYFLMKGFAAGKTFSYSKNKPFKLVRDKIEPVQSLDRQD